MLKRSRNNELLASGVSDGFKWYVGCYDIPSIGISPKVGLTIPVYLAYIDVTGTKLDGVVDDVAVNELGVKFHNDYSCSFVGPATNAELLRENGVDDERWMIGEDYLDIYYNLSSPTSFKESIFDKKTTVKKISKHLEEVTIPSLIKALVLLDIKGEAENKILDCQIAAS